MIRVRFSHFIKMKPSDLIVKAQDIVNGVGSMPHVFPNPMPPLATITTVIGQFQTRTVDAENGDRDKIRVRNIAREVLLSQLFELSQYTMMMSHSNTNGKELIENAGFDVARKRHPLGLLPAPLNVLSALSKEPGAVDLKWKRVYGARSYQVEFIEGTEVGPQAEWKILGTSSKRKFNASGLQPGRFYSFRVRAYGVAGYSAPSEVTTSVVG